MCCGNLFVKKSWCTSESGIFPPMAGPDHISCALRFFLIFDDSPIVFKGPSTNSVLQISTSPGINWSRISSLFISEKQETSKYFVHCRCHLFLKDVVKNPIYSTGIGLILFGNDPKNNSKWISESNHRGSFFYNFKNWFHKNFW